MPKHSRYVTSKMIKTKVLLTNPIISHYIPTTLWLTEENLIQMVNHYPFVFIKPDIGGGGGGALQIKQKDSDVYECCNLKDQQIVEKVNLMEWIEQNKLKDKNYIIQNGISLAKINERIFDLRVFTQWVPKKWEIAGICARVAPVGKIVTNHCQGGRPLTFHEAVSPLYNGDLSQIEKCKEEILKLSHEVAKTLHRRFLGLRELGIDIGIDVDKKIWIFEVNTKPRFVMFSKLSDKRMYHQIKKTHDRMIRGIKS
jgi:glutathione synthase/RimK-type ligase-like ATP-grasp enzyme